ncbi:antirestriction protein ArdC [Nitrobacter vulgaris]|uniref:ArdC family protein n=1 Tax=Nitrobacter vulgaris TaxID=29421 RepID=UPI00285FEAAB|nr:zincin-like metallopeptidase domain-containing protein [Nitrobacter vulgaris]MDR6305881.1 antirestriction protein ArdC [Nitrobacter vulgaris]
MRTFSLFNVAQCDGLPHNEPVADLPEHERNERTEAFFDAIGAEVRWGEPMAAYIPSRDIIVMPERGAFDNPESLYAVWAHEHIHYTGHKTRLDRDLKSRFDNDAYAFEELVAEIGAAMTCAHLQIKGELRHASYVDHWLKVLRQDSRAILSAASLASKATDYLRSFSEDKQEQAA